MSEDQHCGFPYRAVTIVSDLHSAVPEAIRYPDSFIQEVGI